MKRSTFFVVTMVMIIAMTVGYLYWISTRVWPGVERRAVQEVENIISKMVNALATEEDYDVEKLYIVEKNVRYVLHASHICHFCFRLTALASWP